MRSTKYIIRRKPETRIKLDSEITLNAIRKLNSSALKLFMLLQCFTSIDSDLELSYQQIVELTKISKTSVRTAFDELMAEGFLLKTKEENVLLFTSTNF